jgi:hypothetical protein
MSVYLGDAQRLILGPLFRWPPADGRERWSRRASVLVVAIGDQLETTRSHAGMAPPAEPPMHRLPAAISAPAVTPVRARSQHPRTAIHEQPIVRFPSP